MAENKAENTETGGKKSAGIKGRVLSYCIIAVCVAVLIHGSVNLIRTLNNYRVADELYSETVDEFVSMGDVWYEEEPIPDDSGESRNGGESSSDKSNANKTSEEKGSSNKTSTEKTVTGKSQNSTKKAGSKRPASINFNKLREINPDVIGWIYIGGANVNYPIVKGKNNDYYLHRDYRKKSLFAGSIFADYRDSSDFSDLNAVIYGHNMKNGSMFGRLRRLSKKSVYGSDPYIWIYTPQGTRCYEISAVFQTDAGSYVYTIFKKHGKDYTKWVNKINKHTLSGLNKLPSDEESKCITLSTCTGSASRRTVVVASLVRERSDDKD